MNLEKVLRRVREDKKELAEQYNTDESKIVWIGNRNYIVILRDGKEIRIGVSA